MHALLTGVRSPREAWAEISQRSKTLNILDACTLLWAWMCICILVDADNLQGLDYQSSTLPVTPKDPALLEKRFQNFQLVLPHASA